MYLISFQLPRLENKKYVQVYTDLQKLWSETQQDGEMAFLWRNLADFLLQPMFDLQSIMMMYIALDRYASLFVVGARPKQQFYSSKFRVTGRSLRIERDWHTFWLPHWYLHSSWWALEFNILFFHLKVSFMHGQCLFVTGCLSYGFSLALLLLPSAISFLLLSVCLVIKKERLNYDPGFSISLSKWVANYISVLFFWKWNSTNERYPTLEYYLSTFRALVRVLYVFVIIDFISRIFLFFRLAEDNIDFVVLTGSENGDAVLHTLFTIGLQVRPSITCFQFDHMVWPVTFQTSICVYYLAPLYIPVALTVFVKHFRDSVKLRLLNHED